MDVRLQLQRLLLNTVFEITDFTKEQIQELELGIETLGNISYLDPSISVEDMRNIRTMNNKIIKLKINLSH